MGTVGKPLGRLPGPRDGPRQGSAVGAALAGSPSAAERAPVDAGLNGRDIAVGVPGRTLVPGLGVGGEIRVRHPPGDLADRIGIAGRRRHGARIGHRVAGRIGRAGPQVDHRDRYLISSPGRGGEGDGDRRRGRAGARDAGDHARAVPEQDREAGRGERVAEQRLGEGDGQRRGAPCGLHAFRQRRHRVDGDRPGDQRGIVLAGVDGAEGEGVRAVGQGGGRGVAPRDLGRRAARAGDPGGGERSPVDARLHRGHAPVVVAGSAAEGGSLLVGGRPVRGPRGHRGHRRRRVERPFHVARPDLGRDRPAGHLRHTLDVQEGLVGVPVPHPGRRGERRRVADEPGVAEVRGRPRLAGRGLADGRRRPGPPRDHLLQDLGDLIRDPRRDGLDRGGGSVVEDLPRRVGDPGRELRGPVDPAGGEGGIGRGHLQRGHAGAAEGQRGHGRQVGLADVAAERPAVDLGGHDAAGGRDSHLLRDVDNCLGSDLQDELGIDGVDGVHRGVRDADVAEGLPTEVGDTPGGPSPGTEVCRPGVGGIR